MSSVVAAAGMHVFADFHGVAAALLRDASGLESLLKRAARSAGAQVLHSHFHSFGTEEGVTGVVLLAESHISIHTWPESEFAALDIFLCGNASTQRALDCLAETLQPKRQKVSRLRRGLTD